MTKLEELEGRRDKLAGDVAAMQMALDELDGSEELTAVQRMTNDLDASTRLLAALDRQLDQVREAQRAEARAALERQRAEAAAAAAKIDDELRRQLWGVFELVQKRCAATAVNPYAAGMSNSMRGAVLQLMRAVGVDMEVTATNYIAQPVKGR